MRERKRMTFLFFENSGLDTLLESGRMKQWIELCIARQVFRVITHILKTERTLDWVTHFGESLSSGR